MDEMYICPGCHIQVRQTDYFCYNCGKNLHPRSLSTTLATQVLYYLGSLVLPPMGIVWGIRYLREQNNNAKIIGGIMIILTFIELFILIQFTIQIINMINTQVTNQTNSLLGL